MKEAFNWIVDEMEWEWGIDRSFTLHSFFYVRWINSVSLWIRSLEKMAANFCFRVCGFPLRNRPHLSTQAGIDFDNFWLYSVWSSTFFTFKLLMVLETDQISIIDPLYYIEPLMSASPLILQLAF